MPVAYKVRQGGLMRCCLMTLDEKMLNAALGPQEGDRVKCRYCQNGTGWMIYRDGAWEWDRDYVG